MAAHSFRFGIEEEYFVVNRRTGGVKSRLSTRFMKAAKRKLGPSLMYELLQSQLEVATKPVASGAEARAQLQQFRSSLAAIGRDHNVGIVAAGTHPLALPSEQKVTQKPRYAAAGEELGMVAWGTPVCGLHVHVEVPEPELRVNLMHRLVRYLPVLLAVSTSSPFWAKCRTGLLGYRNAVNDTFPRSGLPELFHSVEDYQAYVSALVEAKLIRDPTHIWWALRPSLRHPTIELRITDSCTVIDDAVAIAALYRALVRHVLQRDGEGADYCSVARALTEENRWRAQRYGTEGVYVDPATKQAIRFADFLDAVIHEVADDIAALGIEAQVAHLRAIVQRGTSAHRQIALYEKLRRQGRAHAASLQEVARWLRLSTEAGEFVDETVRLAA